jgi:hypothetical protein
LQNEQNEVALRAVDRIWGVSLRDPWPEEIQLWPARTANPGLARLAVRIVQKSGGSVWFWIILRGIVSVWPFPVIVRRRFSAVPSPEQQIALQPFPH